MWARAPVHERYARMTVQARHLAQRTRSLPLPPLHSGHTPYFAILSRPRVKRPICPSVTCVMCQVQCHEMSCACLQLRREMKFQQRIDEKAEKASQMETDVRMDPDLPQSGPSNPHATLYIILDLSQFS